MDGISQLDQGFTFTGIDTDDSSNRTITITGPEESGLDNFEIVWPGNVPVAGDILRIETLTSTATTYSLNLEWAEDSGGAFTETGTNLYTSSLTAPTGINNFIAGVSASSGLTGDRNVIIGASAGSDTCGDSNVAIGYNTLASMTNDGGENYNSYNIAIGTNALQNGNAISSNFDNYGNIAIGQNALSALVLGGSNVCIGDSAGVNYTGDDSVFIGAGSGQNATGAGNVIIGGYSGLDITTGRFNTLVGTYCETSGENNVVIGYVADAYTGSPSRGVCIGSISAYRDDCVAIGYIADNSGIDSVAIGSEASSGLTSVAIGSEAKAGTSSFDDCIAIGHRAIANTSSGSVIIGADTVGGLRSVGIGTGVGAGGEDSVIIGYQASTADTTTNKNVVIGSLTCPTVSNFALDVVIGYGATLDTNTRDGCVVIGPEANIAARGVKTTANNQLLIQLGFSGLSTDASLLTDLVPTVGAPAGGAPTGGGDAVAVLPITLNVGGTPTTYNLYLY